MGDGQMQILAVLEQVRGLDEAQAVEYLAQGDPLGLGERSKELLRREGLLVDPQRLFESGLVETACDACLSETLPGAGEVGAWLEQRLERSLSRILTRDAEWVHGGFQDEDDDPPGLFFARAFHLDPASMHPRVVQFHYLSKRTRRRFFALVLDAWSLSKTAEWFGGDAREIADDLWQALFVLGLVTENERDGMLDALLRGELARETQP